MMWGKLQRLGWSWVFLSVECTATRLITCSDLELSHLLCRFILCVLIAELLHNMFNIAYDLDLVDEQESYNWRDDDQVMYGKGTAVASVKPFFDWLKADKSSEQT